MTPAIGHLHPILRFAHRGMPLYPLASPVVAPMVSSTKNLQLEQHTRLHESRQRSRMSSSTPLDCPTNTTVSLVTQSVGKHDAQEHIVLPPSEERSMHLEVAPIVAHRVVGGMSQSLSKRLSWPCLPPCSYVFDELADGIPHSR